MRKLFSFSRSAFCVKQNGSLVASSECSSGRSLRRRGNQNLIGYAIAGALTIGAVIAVVSMGATSRENSKADLLFSEINGIANQMRSQFSGDYTQFGAAAASSALLVSLRMIPTDFVIAGSAVTPWGGALQVNGTSSTRFYIDIRNTTLPPEVPQTVCVSVVNRLAGMSGLVDFQVNGGAALGTNNPTVADATALCTGSAYAIFQ